MLADRMRHGCCRDLSSSGHPTDRRPVYGTLRTVQLTAPHSDPEAKVITGAT